MENNYPGNNPLPTETCTGSHEPVSPVMTPQSPENAQTSQSSSSLQSSPSPESVKPKASKSKTPKLVERHTALRGASISPCRTPQSTRRKNTWNDLNEREPEIPYLKAERANRDLVCSLMERQDRMNEALFLNINDMQYRLDDMDAKLRDLVPGYDSDEVAVTA
jgi:hypothetical protein